MTKHSWLIVELSLQLDLCSLSVLTCGQHLFTPVQTRSCVQLLGTSTSMVSVGRFCRQTWKEGPYQKICWFCSKCRWFLLEQVETYGSMERREKVEFILEQMRLCLAKKDYIRTQIISKKISPKVFENNQEQVTC